MSDFSVIAVLLRILVVVILRQKGAWLTLFFNFGLFLGNIGDVAHFTLASWRIKREAKPRHGRKRIMACKHVIQYASMHGMCRKEHGLLRKLAWSNLVIATQNPR